MRTSIAIIILLAVVGIATYLLIHFKPATAPSGTASTTPPTAIFYCSNNTAMQAVFATSSVALTLTDGRSFTLPQTMSGSGIRYEASTTNADLVFTSKGDSAFFAENGKTTYEDCTAAKIAQSDAPGYATYTDLSGTFTFAFPTNFIVGGSAPGYSQDWSAQATTSGMVLAKILVPQSAMPGTNFGDAKFTVGTSADPAAISSCLTNPSPNVSSTTQTSIGGVSFTKLTFSDAAAGNRYDTTSYRTVRNNQCYAVEYTIHYGVSQNYPKGSVKEFNEAQMQAALDELAQSFQFLQ